MTNTYSIKVTVEIEYEVDAESWELAEAEGYKWEDYKQFGSIYSIDVTQETDDEEESDSDEADDEV